MIFVPVSAEAPAGRRQPTQRQASTATPSALVLRKLADAKFRIIEITNLPVAPGDSGCSPRNASALCRTRVGPLGCGATHPSGPPAAHRAARGDPKGGGAPPAAEQGGGRSAHNLTH